MTVLFKRNSKISSVCGSGVLDSYEVKKLLVRADLTIEKRLPRHLSLNLNSKPKKVTKFKSLTLT